VSKPVFGLILGGILGIFDGLSALVSAPEVAPQIVGIVIGSTIKGLITGVLIGYFARKVHSLPLGLLFGLGVGALLAYGVVAMQIAQGGKAYYLPIMLPGAVLGLIVGYATQRHAERANRAGAAQ
jgi:hypothetical protein